MDVGWMMDEGEVDDEGLVDEGWMRERWMDGSTVAASLLSLFSNPEELWFHG